MVEVHRSREVHVARALPLVLALLLAGCSHDRGTCEAGDLPCYGANLLWVEDDGGPTDPVTVTLIRARLPTNSLDPDTPSVSLSPDALDFESANVVGQLDTTWNDPRGCRPALCTTVCAHGVCATPRQCARPVPDGLVSGVWRTWIGFTALPADPPSTDTFSLEMTPVTAPDCGDPITWLAEQDAAGVAEPIPDPESGILFGAFFEIEITLTNTGTPPDSGGGGTCSTSSQCGSFGNQYCGGSANARCSGVDDLCHCCLTLPNNTCAQTCQTSADCSDQSNTHCADGVCVFDSGGAP